MGEDFRGHDPSARSPAVRRLVLCAALAGASLWAGSAHASGISLGKFGGIYGHANADGGLAIYYNPARLSLDPGLYGTLDVSLVLRGASYDRETTTTNSSDPTVAAAERRFNTGEATLNNVAPLPLLAIGYTADLEGIKLGGALGAFPTFGGIAEWDKKDESAQFPGVVDGPQRWASIATRLVIINFTLAGSVTFEELGLGLGASVAYVHGDIDTVRARNLDETDALVDSAGFITEGRAHLDASDDAFAFSFGLSYERDNFKTGIHYRHSYDLELVGPIRQAYGTNPPAPTEDGRVVMKLPAIINWAVTPRFGQFEATLAAEYATWSRLETNDVFTADTNQRILEIPRQLEDSVGGKLIPGWHFDEHWLGSVMFGFETSAVPTETLEAGFMDAPKLQFGAGGRFDADQVKISLSWHRDHFLEVTVDDSIQKPTANGSYRDHRDFFDITLEGRL